MAAFAWSLAASALAADPRVAIDLPAGSLGAALALLGRQTGASFGTAQPLPAATVAALHGRLSTEAALQRLLTRIHWRAVALGDRVWRLEPQPRQRRRPARPRPSSAVPPPMATRAPDDIVVTATKQSERLATAPFPLAVIPGDALVPLSPAPDTGDAATLVNGLSVTNLGAGRDRLFVRGVADSPFDGFGQSSVSVQVGEARATYDAPDPDLRLIDMQQVELLKGPQGPLYGTGALGGVWRLVPAPPLLDRASGDGEVGGYVNGSGAGAGLIEAVANVPIVTDRIGVRLVGYRIGQGGWIDDEGGRRNVNDGQTSGLRLGLRVIPADRWTVDVTALTQLASTSDSQYVEHRDSLSRTARGPEPQDTDIALASVTTHGHLGTLDLVTVASIARQEIDATYDVSGSALVAGSMAPASYRDDRHYQVATGEARVGRRGDTVDWLVGASLLDATTDATGTLASIAGTAGILSFHRKVDELSLFGEATWHLSPQLDVTGGLRAFRSAVDDQRSDLGVSAATAAASLRATPSATLAWRPRSPLLFHARYAAAYRPGGTQAPSAIGNAAATYGGDRLASFDLGARWTGRRVFADADLFRTRWHDVQAELIAPGGLVGTGNFGDAANLGVDMTLGWTPDPHWTLGMGLLRQHPRLRPTGGAAYTLRLPIVPDASGHAEIGYRTTVGDWQLEGQLRAAYRGPARLSFLPGLDRRLDAVLTSGASLAASRGRWTWRLWLDNLADSRSDTFPFGNPFTIAASEQHVPQRPRTASLSLRRRW